MMAGTLYVCLQTDCYTKVAIWWTNVFAKSTVIYSHLCSTRTLIIGLAQRSTDNQITVQAQVTGYLSSNLLLSNYVGQLTRVRLAKQTLDDHQILYIYYVLFLYTVG